MSLPQEILPFFPKLCETYKGNLVGKGSKLVRNLRGLELEVRGREVCVNHVEKESIKMMLQCSPWSAGYLPALLKQVLLKALA